MKRKQEMVIGVIQLIATGMLFLFGEFAPVVDKVAIGAFVVGYLLQTGAMFYYCIFEFKKKNFVNNYLIIILATGTLMAMKNYQGALMVLIVFSCFSQTVKYLIDKAEEKFEALKKLLPTETGIFIEGKETRVAIDTLKHGNIVIVKEGELIPGDGRVFTGSAYVDMSEIKGKKEIVQVYKGDIVFGGAVNRKGILQVELIGDPQSSLIYRLVNKVIDGKESRGTLEQKGQRAFKVLKPLFLLSSFVVALGVPFFMGYLYGPWLLKGIALLFLASSDTVAMNVHLATSSLIYDLYLKGVIAKDICAVETFAKVEAIVIDKKLSLEEGGYTVTKIENMEGSKEEIITLAAHIEHFSKHPVARAIVHGFIQLAKYEGIAEKNPIKEKAVRKFEEIEGKGVTGFVGGHFVCAGSDELMAILNIQNVEKNKEHKRVHVAIDQKYYGYIEMEYKSAGDTEDVYGIWRKAGIKKCAIAGDNFESILDELRDGGCDKKRIAFIGEAQLSEKRHRKIGAYISINAFNNAMARENGDVFIMDGSFKRVAEIKTLGRTSIGKVNKKFFLGCFGKLIVYGTGIFLGPPLYSLIAIDGVITLMLAIDIGKRL